MLFCGGSCGVVVGTGKWTIQEAAERTIPAPTMSAALDVRYLSALKEDRITASHLFTGPTGPGGRMPPVDREQLVDDVRQALYAAKICSYAQGMNLIREAAKQNKWSVNLGDCARIWKGGCIIRAKFLDRCAPARFAAGSRRLFSPLVAHVVCAGAPALCCACPGSPRRMSATLSCRRCCLMRSSPRS